MAAICKVTGIGCNSQSRTGVETNKNITLQKVAKFILAIGLGLCFFSPVIGAAIALSSYGSLAILKKVNAPDANYFSINRAASEGRLSKIRFLISVLGANPNLPDINGNAPLHWAAYLGHLKCLEYLVKAGGNVNQRGNKGQVPLHCAVKRLQLESVVYLMAFKANPNIKNDAGCTPIDRARSFWEFMKKDPVNDRYFSDDTRSREMRFYATKNIYNLLTSGNWTKTAASH